MASDFRADIEAIGRIPTVPTILDVVCRIVHRHGGAMQVTRAEQPNETVPKIFLLQQNEDCDDEDDGRCRNRVQRWRNDAFGKFDG